MIDLEQGYAVMRGFLKQDAIDLLLAAYKEIEQSQARPSSQILYTHALPKEERPHLKEIAFQWFNLFRRDLENPITPIYDLVKSEMAAMGLVDYSLFQDSFIQKLNTKTPFHWHQDYPFWPVDRPDGWTVWVALDPVDASNGSMEIAIGSNRLGIEPVVDLHTGSAQLPSQSSVFDSADFQVIRPDLEPGDALFFHGLTYHYSEPNSSEKSRRAWASVWMGPEVRWDTARAPRHFICKMVNDGEQVAGFWD